MKQINTRFPVMLGTFITQYYTTLAVSILFRKNANQLIFIMFNNC